MHDATAACQRTSERATALKMGVALAQRNRRSVSENAPLKNRSNKTILARRSGIEDYRNLLGLNSSSVNDQRKEWLAMPEPDRFRNRLRRRQHGCLQTLATGEIAASISVPRLRCMLFLRMHRTLRTSTRVRWRRWRGQHTVVAGDKPCRHRHSRNKASTNCGSAVQVKLESIAFC